MDDAELMIMGFISLLLTVFQSRIGRICVSEDLANKWLPCERKKQGQNGNSVSHAITIPQLLHATGRHLLSEEGDPTYCQQQVLFIFLTQNYTISEHPRFYFLLFIFLDC